MKKLTLLLAAGALWLFLAAVPAFADGGPHVSAINSGAGTGSTLTADSCAGCHRAHTAQGALLLAAPDEEALCLSCHGAAGTGSTVDVESGIQYTLAAGERGGAVLGALRNGGFINARIDSENPFRLTYARTATATSQRTKVSVLAAGQPVTSSHLALATDVVSQGIAWGNGPLGANTAGQPLAMECATCHNPHGNGNYRILNPLPGDDDDPSTTPPTEGPFIEPTTAVNVTDAALPPTGDTRNYTVIQLRNNTGSMTASEVQAIAGYNNLMGDYFHRTVPWDPQVDDTVVGSSTGLTSNDAPNGLPATFDAQINQWCAQCHSRYLAGSGSYQNDSGDSVFRYRHTNTSNKPCTTCHVAHGTNATMPGGATTSFVTNFPYPDGTESDSSRLLKIDNRGTCQACHDPTGTVAPGTYSGPTPANYVP